jgi:hypothetical protein
MACNVVIKGPSIMAFNCTLGRQHVHCKASGCTNLASASCTFETPNGKKPTCQMPLCERCAVKTPTNLLCPPHARFVARG